MRVGQQKAVDNILNEWSGDRGNRFIILVGPEGSGKSLVAQEVSRGMNRVDVAGTVAEVRKAVSLAYRVAQPTVYAIDKGDSLSPASKNTLLKVTEEPPNRARFILEARQESSVLETLLSRGKVVRLEPFTPAQIEEYIDLICKDSAQTKDSVFDILSKTCWTPGIVDKMLQYNVEAFYEFARNIVLEIRNVSLTNALKSASKISFKDGEDGYNVELLFELLKFVASAVIRSKQYNNLQEHVNLVRTISKYGRMLRQTGVNKKAIYDMFILEARATNT